MSQWTAPFSAFSTGSKAKISHLNICTGSEPRAAFLLLVFIAWENRTQQKLFPCSRGALLNFFFSLIKKKSALCFTSTFWALWCLSKYKFTSVSGTWTGVKALEEFRFWKWDRKALWWVRNQDQMSVAPRKAVKSLQSLSFSTFCIWQMLFHWILITAPKQEGRGENL